MQRWVNGKVRQCTLPQARRHTAYLDECSTSDLLFRQRPRSAQVTPGGFQEPAQEHMRLELSALQDPMTSLVNERLQLGCRCASFNLCNLLLCREMFVSVPPPGYLSSLNSFLRCYICYVSALIKAHGCCCQTKPQNKTRRVTSERNSPSQFCPNMLAIVWPCKKLPMEILESLPLFLKEKQAFIWKSRTPGNDRHSLWIV